MKVPAKLNDLPEAYKAILRESFVENECGTDEYRETQPKKGLGYITACIDALSNQKDTSDGLDLDAEVGPGFRLAGVGGAQGGPATRREAIMAVLHLSREWVEAAVGRYAGNDLLMPVLTIYFDVLWEMGEHPYYGSDPNGIREVLDFHRDVGDLDDDYEIIPKDERV